MRWRYHTGARELYKEVYENYSKKGKTVLAPGLGFHDDIILPPSALRWLQRQPERLVSANASQTEVIQPFYGLGHDKFIDDPWAGMLVKTALNEVLENVCAAMNDELGLAVDSRFGTDTKVWRDIDLMPTVRMIVAQAATRFTLGGSPTGRKLCHDQNYLKACLDISDALVVSAGLGGASPKLLRPILGRIGGITARRQIKDLEKYFEPVLRERMRMLEEEAANPGMEMPEDHLQMMLRYALKERQDEVFNVPDMTKRLCVANFGSMHQTAIQVVNILLNIIASDTEFDTISILRDEATRVAGDSGPSAGWDKARVAAMTRADSVARETLRLYSFSLRSVARRIVGDGLVTEDGIALPRGSTVSVIAYWSQTDGDAFADPFKYDPFRFSRAREAASTAVDDGQDSGGGGSGGSSSSNRAGLPSLSFVSTGAQNLAFSHGKHACPGRFLVDFELKMIIAHVLLNYDVDFPPEYEGRRPENRWLADACIPPSDVRIRVRRRERV
ncbi:putative cytochrome P450 [Rosellinia necatrix]|uniref:Putative cytochrome P450 n=1 Tax=Rosellinia necatrix TaxID=77044 RepID=A0A1S7UNY2_ROSNE|nr:putative cytochrome P450 [Rosellinia necatrix]